MGLELNGNKSYVVKEVYNVLQREGSSEIGKIFSYIWRLPIPSKIKGFIWKIAHNRIQTMDNLKLRNIIPSGTCTSCILCKTEEETAQHWFFECKVSLSLWTQCYINLVG